MATEQGHCENCGNRRDNSPHGKLIQRGMFAGCWVCCPECDRDLHTTPPGPSSRDEQRWERRQMGLTAC